MIIKASNICIRVLTLVFAFIINAEAQNKSNTLSLEDIFSKSAYAQTAFGPVRWMKDGNGYSTLEPNSRIGGTDIVRYDVTNNKREVLVSADLLLGPQGAKPLHIDDYQWSADDNKILIFTNTKRVWRYNTKGDYWVLDLKTKKLYQLGKNLERSTMMFAKFSPDGKRVAYVCQNNIFVEDFLDARLIQLTSDGSEHIVNGTFDWVYEEELDCRDGFRWSPDGENIAYWQSDTKAIGTFYMINNVDSIYSKPIPLPYPKVGTTLSAVKIGVISASGGSTRWFNIPGDSRNNYLARMDFIPESGEVMIQQLNRTQDTNRIWIGDIKTLSLKNILTETDSAFLDIHDDILWMESQKYFTWTSEEDGWRHLYKVSRDGKSKSLITKGNFDVIQISCIDTSGKYVYYIASPEDPTQRHLYKSQLDGSGSPQLVTPASFKGHNAYQMSPNAKWAIHTFENAETPPFISLVYVPDHRSVKTMQDNRELKAKFDGLGLTKKEFFKLDIGDIQLDAWMIKPANFDSQKKYPVLFYVYGEPAGSTVQNNWAGGELWHHFMAQKGIIVVSIDNRGTKVPRGRDWRKSIYGQIGILASQDQSKAAQKLFQTFSFIDTSRVGIWGWSGGGQMTLNCLFRYPNIYKTGLAVAFVSDQRLYDATYQERYMGLLGDNPKGYYDGSPINHVKGLKGELMIIHGTADDNVHYQSFEMLINELIKENKSFHMMSYPMRAHGINERKNTSLHLRKTMENFWNNHLLKK